MELEIYTDCGGSTADYGIGIHMISQDESEKSFLLKTHIDSINAEYGINEVGSTSIGEIYAIITALSLVESDIKKVRVFTDSDHAFCILNKVKPPKEQKDHLQLLQGIFDKFLEKFEVEVMWIKGHVGVYGNEIVDSITQKALKNSVIKNKIHQVEIPIKGQPVKYVI
jgi:ribonuclease HI